MEQLADSSSALNVLLTAAVTIAAGHTVIGIDHSLPFIVLGRARGWSLARVLTVTGLCGVGHVLSSVLLGFVGIGIGVALERLEWIEAARGSIAAWLLIGFGALYAARAWVRVQRRKPHTHGHVHAHAHGHAHGEEHTHLHDHSAPEHMHPHEVAGQSVVTIWALFIVFAFGPCEPLIPLLMAPAAVHNWLWVALVSLVFGAVTIGVMMLVVSVGYLGLSSVRMAWAEKHADVLAGVAIACSGLAIQVFGI
jgi:nickel/cobalt transporter (NicO) family protein